MEGIKTPTISQMVHANPVGRADGPKQPVVEVSSGDRQPFFAQERVRKLLISRWREKG